MALRGLCPNGSAAADLAALAREEAAAVHAQLSAQADAALGQSAGADAACAELHAKIDAQQARLSE